MNFAPFSAFDSLPGGIEMCVLCTGARTMYLKTKMDILNEL